MKKYSKNLKLISKYFLKYKGPIPCLLIKYMKLIEIYNLAKINKITNKTIDYNKYCILNQIPLYYHLGPVIINNVKLHIIN